MAFSNELAVATTLARTAAPIALAHYGKVARLEKTHIAASQEAVTQADRDVQAHIVAGLKRAFPNDAVIGEEDDSGLGITNTTTDPMGRVWVIDPIDGTNNFIAGFGNFAVCIGLLVGGMPVVGVVHDVTRDLTYRAAKGEGAFAGERKVACLTTPLSASSVLLTTANNLRPDGTIPPFVDRWMRQIHWKIRILGSAAIEACVVGSGAAHGAVTLNGKLWDVAAAAAIVLEAGGRIVDLKGHDLFPFNLANYTGAKTPFLACAPLATDTLVREMNT